MPNQPDLPDLCFDIDALFDHMRTNLEHQLDDEKEWSFTFRDESLEKLTRIAESLDSEFDVHLQEETETHENGRVFMGPPLLAVVIIGALQPEEVKSLAARFTRLAADESIEYEGVSVADPLDMDEFMDWLDLEGACWRLRVFSDNGLPPGEEIPYIFLLETDDRPAAEAGAAALAAAGFDRAEVVDEEGETGVLVRVAGLNDEDLLKSTYTQVERIAAAQNATLVGVQFWDEDEFD